MSTSTQQKPSPGTSNSLQVPSVSQKTKTAIGEADDNKYNNVEFLMTPMKGRKLDHFKVTRYRGTNFIENRYPEYELWYECNRKRYFIMSAKREKTLTTPKYGLYLDRDFVDDPIGSVKSNFKGTHWSINYGTHKGDVEYMAAVKYDTNVFGMKGPRAMTVSIPELKYDESEDIRYRFTDSSGSSNHRSLISRLQEEIYEHMILMITNSPEWDTELGAHRLDFKGRVNAISVRNFQLVYKGLLGTFADSTGNNVRLQFGRFGNDSFILDFSSPICPIQAFGIALTSLDNKLGCE